MEKKILVTRSSMPGFEEYCEEIKKLWDTHWITNMGEMHAELQHKLEAFFKCPHVVLHTNGHLALENVISAFNFPPGSEIITTPFTFASTTHAIVRNGFMPVFCDIKEDDYTLDPEMLEALITDKTAAIVPVHVYGNMCDVTRIDEIAKAHGLKVIYDAAHTFGVEYKGRSSANFGDASIFSFHATKVFNTIEGGAVCFSDDKLMTVINDLKDFGIRDGEEDIKRPGGNAKMNEFQAAMGLCNLRHIGENIKKRKLVVERYNENLRETPGIRLCGTQKDVKHNYSYMPVVFDGFRATRDEVAEALKQQGIFARKYFYPLTNSFECYRKIPGSDISKTPVAAHIADRVLTLPLYPDLALEDVDRICRIILSLSS